eukprot:11168554-Lingulodinium_polyedra.AAC.1
MRAVLRQQIALASASLTVSARGKLFRRAFRNAIGCCSAARFAITAFRASPNLRRSSFGLRKSRNALFCSNLLRS